MSNPLSGRSGHSELPALARATLGRDLEDLLRPVSWLYGLDLTLSAALGWTAFGLAATRESPLAWVAWSVVATLAQLRALVFLHEISHGRCSRCFEAFWNAVVGIPMGVPSLMYVGSHLQHHVTERFATPADPEYAPLAAWGTARRLLFVLTGLLVPVLLVLRWGVLAPLSLGPLPGAQRLRPWVVSRCSTLAINPGYARSPRADRALPTWRSLEWASAGFVWAVAVGAMSGVVAPAFVAQWLVVVGGVFLLNQVRTLAAHGYQHFGRRLDRDGQFRDSINLAPSLWTVLIAPLGLRHHALHHLLPALPYHSLGRAHRLLSRRLEAGSPYRLRGQQGLVEALRALAGSARA